MCLVLGLLALCGHSIALHGGPAVSAYCPNPHHSSPKLLPNQPHLNKPLSTSQFPKVRATVLDLQRQLASSPPPPFKGSVLDGRDCGTVICPEARYKFYITADQEIRAQRRFDELRERGDMITLETVEHDMKERDQRDTNRDANPLKPAENAVIIDTSEMSIDEAFEHLLKLT